MTAASDRPNLGRVTPCCTSSAFSGTSCAPASAPSARPSAAISARRPSSGRSSRPSRSSSPRSSAPSCTTSSTTRAVTSRSAAPSRSAGSADRRHRRGDDRGVGSLELAIIAPSLLLLIFFLIQAVLWFYARSVALQAARDGVTQLRLDQTSDACEADKPVISQKVLDFASQVGSGAL